MAGPLFIRKCFRLLRSERLLFAGYGSEHDMNAGWLRVKEECRMGWGGRGGGGGGAGGSWNHVDAAEWPGGCGRQRQSISAPASINIV